MHRSTISAFHELMVCLQENTLAFFHWYMAYLISGHQNVDMFVLDVRQVLDFAKEKFGDIDQLSNE